MRPETRIGGSSGAESGGEGKEQALRERVENMDFDTLNKAMEMSFGSEEASKKYYTSMNAEELQSVISSAEKIKKKEKSKKLGMRTAIVAGALSLVGGAFMLFGKNGGAGDSGEGATVSRSVDQSKPKHQPYDQLTQYDFKEDNESLRERMTYKGKFANEDGTGYNEDKVGDYNFSRGPEDVEDMTSDELKESFKSSMEQRSQLACTYVVILSRTKDPNFPVAGYENWTDINGLTKLMHEDPDLEQKIYDAVIKYVDGDEELGTSTEAKPTTLNGTKMDAYMDYDFESGKKNGIDIDEADTTIVTYEDTKVDAPGMTMTHVYYIDNMQYSDSIDWLAPCDWQPWLDITEIDPDIPPVKKEEPPTEEPPTEEPPTEEPPTEEPPTENPPSDAKKPFNQQGVEQGMEDVHITPTTQQDAVETQPSTEGFKNEYKPDLNNDGSTGAEKNDVAPDSNTQTGAQDTSEQSRDGSGRTVEQVTRDADKTDANRENQSTHYNGSERDTQRVEEDRRNRQQQEQNNANYANPTNNTGKQNENISNDQASDLFSSGDF